MINKLTIELVDQFTQNFLPYTANPHTEKGHASETHKRIIGIMVFGLQYQLKTSSLSLPLESALLLTGISQELLLWMDISKAFDKV